MSTPIVSAVSALMMQGAENFTSMNSTEKKYYLIHTGDLINDTQRLFSRINAYNALTENITNDLTEGNLSVSNATIINYTTLTAPTINAVTLNSTYGTNLSSENLTASFTISSGNAAFNTTDWHINGTSIAVLNMPFNKQVTSTTANAVPDYTTYVRNGTLGSSTLTPAWTSSGYIGGGYDFDEDVGAEDRITFTDFTPSSTTPWTFTSWVYLRDTADDAFYAGDTGYYNALRFNKLSGYMGIRQDNGSSYYTTIQSNVIRNKWAMVTWVANGAGVLSLYINGTIQDAILSNTGITFNCLGHCYGSSGNSFYGILDEVMLFNRSLSSEQIAYLYQESLNKRMMQIHYEETEKGENWSVAITSNNGTADGNTVLSDGLIIIDNAPTVSLTSPSNYSKQNSSVGFTATITDDAETTKVELYTNDTGSWASRETRYPGESIYNRTGLQALYHFNNESEFAESVSRIYDFSGRGNNLTCGTCGTVGHVGVIDEAWYKAYTDAISYNSTANFNLGAVTVTFWMKDSEKVNPCIFDIIVAGTGGGYFCFNYTSTDRPILSLSSTNYRYFNSAGQDAIDGLWHFIVVRTPGNAQNDIANATLRIDGVDIPVYSTVNTSAPPSFDGILIGSADGSGSYDYEGYLDEFAVFNRYLSDAEVDAIYNARNTEKYSMQAVFQNRTLAEGDYLWNVKATDKYSQVGWAASNNTFWVGNKAPVVSSVV
ncbi:TPA: LamG domain-containing protein, partial [Candidatus Woesearchaeota archaeon]|nr:LamG domain-containing protein [Candidatus Woesearchaeota archaeon]